MKKKPAKKTTAKTRKPTKKLKALFSNTRDFLLFVGSVVVISICVFYLFNLFQM